MRGKTKLRMEYGRVINRFVQVSAGCITAADFVKVRTRKVELAGFNSAFYCNSC